MSTQQEDKGWIGVDLDGTLALYDKYRGPTHIGPPVPLMLARVKAWLAQGIEVRIFTARAASKGVELIHVTDAIQSWCQYHIGEALPVTCTKDFRMVELWDDRAVQVIPNTGICADGRDYVATEVING